MTEPKRRGRPRKIESFEALKEEVDQAINEYGVPPNPIAELTGNEYTFEPRSSTVKKNGEVISEKLIPPAGLSKVEALKWLTANRK